MQIVGNKIGYDRKTLSALPQVLITVSAVECQKEGRIFEVLSRK